MKKGANRMLEKSAFSNTASKRDVYVAGIGHFLPGDPIPVDSIDEILGEITKAPANVLRRIHRIRPVMRKLLGIDFVHYVLDPVTRKPTESNVSMAVKAATKALNSAGVSPSEIDLIIYAGAFFDYMSPPSSTLVQERLGIDYCAEMAIHSNCTSIYKAIQVASDQISLGRYHTALVVTSQISSTCFKVETLNEEHVTVEQAILRWFLSDGAGAMVLSDKNPGPRKLRVVDTYIESVGTNLENGMTGFAAPGGWDLLEIYRTGKHHVTQDLNRVGKIGPKLTREAFERMLNATGLDTGRVKCLLLNLPMRHLCTFAEVTLKELVANPEARLYSNINMVGYAGPAASLISLDHYLDNNHLKPHDVLISFAVESSKWMHGAFILEQDS